MPRLKLTLIALLFGAAVLVVAPVAEACPNCRTILSESESAETPSAEQAQAAAMARGFSWSVLVMMAVPYLLVGGMGAGLWYVVRKSDGGKTAATGTTPPGPPV